MYNKFKNSQEIIDRINNAIRQRGWTHNDVAKKMGTTGQYISVMLRGARPLTPDKIFTFSEVLGIPIDYLVHGTKNIMRFYPHIEDESVVSSVMLMDSPLDDIIIPAKNHGYNRINGINKDDLLIIYKIQDEEEISEEKIFVASFEKSAPMLSRTKKINETTRFFYSDNGEAPIISEKYHIYGFVKKIVRDV